MRADESTQGNGQRLLQVPEADTRHTRSLGSLLVELTRELNDLFRTEVELTRTEVSSKIEQAATGIMTLIVGGLIAVAGLMALVAAAVIAINEFFLHEWALSALVVGTGVTVVGVIAMVIGKNRVEKHKLVPARTARNVREDVRFLKEEYQRRV
jgi:hypothetical protein